jgi:hypothetical protein
MKIKKFQLRGKQFDMRGSAPAQLRGKIVWKKRVKSTIPKLAILH